MFAVEIELLTERWVATEYNDRGRAEWPPHPARLYSALVAEHVDCELTDAERVAEAAALDWLAERPAPLVIASPETAVARRTVAPHFVPVNDAGSVSQPDGARGKLEEALEAQRVADDPKARAKADKAVDKVREQLANLTASAIASPADASNAIAGAAATLLPERRLRQPRTFPSLTPALPRFVMVWDEAPPPSTRAALDAMLVRLVRLGHSSTFVSARAAAPGAPDRLRSDGAIEYRPSEDSGALVLRVPGAGQRQRLTEAFAKHGGNEPRVLPARFVRYSDQAAERAEPTGVSIFRSDFLVLARVGGPRLPILAAPHVTRALRRALIARAPEPKSPFLTGHRPDGTPAEGPRLALAALPFVGSEHADGSLMGVGLLVPREATQDDVDALAATLRALDRVQGDAEDPADNPIKLALGEAGVLELGPMIWGRTAASLQPMHWSVARRRWATATPLALDRNPGDLHDRDAARRASAFEEAEAIARLAIERMIAPACAGIVSLTVHRSVVLAGSAKPRDFGRFPLGEGKAPRVLVHVTVEFDRPVAGPLVAGAGRYQGMGLFLPVVSHDEPEQRR
jgi:CRISPR-associated protein Csb2